MRELEIEADDPCQHQEVHDVGIGEPVDHILAERHVRRAHRSARQIELDGVAVASRDGAAVGFRDQVVEIFRDQINDVELESLTLADRTTLADGVLEPRFVAAALMRDRLGERGGEVLHLLADLAGLFTTVRVDRMRGTDSGAGSHRGDVGCAHDKGAGRGGSSARRRDVNDKRDVRIEHRLDDGPRRTEQSAGRVETNYQRARAAGLRFCDRAIDEVRGRGIDRSVDVDEVDPTVVRAASAAGVGDAAMPRPITNSKTIAIDKAMRNADRGVSRIARPLPRGFTLIVRMLPSRCYPRDPRCGIGRPSSFITA